MRHLVQLTLRVLILCWAVVLCLHVAHATSDETRLTSPDEDAYRSYVEKVKQIAAGSPKVSPKAIYGYEPFLALAADGSKNMDLCLRFLAEQQQANGRGVAIISMNQLGVDDYVVFIQKLVELHHNSLVDDRELTMAIWWRENDLVIDQYRNPKIQALLTAMDARDDLSADFKETIDIILSGRRWADKLTSAFDRECRQSPRKGSIRFCAGLVARCAKYYLFTQVVYFVLDKPKRHTLQWFDRTFARWRSNHAIG